MHLPTNFFAGLRKHLLSPGVSITHSGRNFMRLEPVTLPQDIVLDAVNQMERHNTLDTLGLNYSPLEKLGLAMLVIEGGKHNVEKGSSESA